jgi:hypothetical protein
MNELDEVWSKMLGHALANAEFSGQRDVADYLALKAANDTIRGASINWLFDSVMELAVEANRINPVIIIENVEAHSFRSGGANLVGSLLRFRQGVRSLTVEAGWTRTPNDGFMKGGALAIARITHFGIAKSNAELMLMRLGEAPQWFSVLSEKERGEFGSGDLRRHFSIFQGS